MFLTFFSFVLSVLTRKLTKPIFRPHQSTTWETLPSARGLPVSLSMTFDISQGKSVFSACSIRVSMPKSIRMQKFLNFHCSLKYSLSKVWVGFILICLNSLYNNEKYHNWWHYSITCNLNLQKQICNNSSVESYSCKEKHRLKKKLVDEAKKCLRIFLSYSQEMDCFLLYRENISKTFFQRIVEST